MVYFGRWFMACFVSHGVILESLVLIDLNKRPREERRQKRAVLWVERYSTTEYTR